MRVEKLFLLPLAAICLVSCNPRNIDPVDPFGNGGQQWNQNPNQNFNQGGGSAPAETSPAYSGTVKDEESSSEDNVANTGFDGIVTITYNGNDATIDGSIEGVSVRKDGARVTATNSGDKKVKYVLTGSSSDGFFKLYSSKKQAIVFKDLTLANSKGAAVNNQSKKRTFIVLEGTNTIGDGEVNGSGDYPEQTDDEDMKAAIFSEGQLAFNGTGKLTVNAVGKSGITSDDYVRFLTGTDVVVNSSNGHGIRGKDAIIVSGGTIQVNLASTATGKKCFTTDSLIYICGGKTTLTNKASAGTVDNELTGAACIKADQLFVIQDGELTVTAEGKGCKCINGDGKGFFEGGKVTAKASGANYGNSSNGRFNDSDNSVSAKAIKFDGNLEFSGANVSASCSSHEAIESKGTIYISGGDIYASSSDDAINSASTMTISGGVVYALSSGNDGLDANGNLIIKGGTVCAVGCGNPEVGIDANTEGGYKLYIQGGNVIAIGGLESNYSISQAIISTSWNRNTTYSLCDGNNVLFTFKTQSSGGSGLYMTAPSLVSGNSYSLITSATVSGAENHCDGILSTGGTATGGNSTSVKASSYSSGGGMGGGMGGPGGWGW